MEVLELQLLFMGIIYAATTCVGMSPILLGKFCTQKLALDSATKSRLLSDASCFGAGVFLFVCFLGLLPAADTKFHAILENLGDSSSSWEAFAEFPWGFFVVTCGFLVIFTIDKMVHALEHWKHEPSLKNTTSFHHLIAATQNSTPTPEIEPSTTEPTSSPAKEEKKSPLNYECHIEACGVFEEGNHGGGVPSSVMFLVALGIHSIFEGIAVGLQTSKEKITEFSVAVLLHELVMAITFGMEVSKSPLLNRSRKLLYVFIFTSTIPVGIGFGVALQNAPSENRELLSAIIEAFATGIFLHVIFIEILANEFPHLQFDRHKCRLAAPQPPKETSSSEICLLLEKILSILCGFTLLILMNVFLHGHSH